MKQHLRWKTVLAGALVLLLVAGTGLPALADGEWPKDTVTDAEGKLYKQVFTSSGGVEVWQLIGVFGTPDDALKSVGVIKDEPKKGSGEEVIGETPYIFDLKKVTGEDTDGGETLKDGESVTIGIRNDQSAKVLIQAEKDGTSITGLESLMLDVTDVSKLFIETEGEKTGAVDSQDAGSSAETEFTEEQGGTTVLEPGMKFAWSKSSGDQDAAYQMTISRNEGQTEVDYRRIRKSYKIAVKAQKKARMKVKESKTVLKPESVVEKDGKTVYGLEQKSKRKLSTRRSRTKRLKDITDKTIPYSQVYIQENRASGR